MKTSPATLVLVFLLIPRLAGATEIFAAPVWQPEPVFLPPGLVFNASAFENMPASAPPPLPAAPAGAMNMNPALPYGAGFEARRNRGGHGNVRAGRR